MQEYLFKLQILMCRTGLIPQDRLPLYHIWLQYRHGIEYGLSSLFLPLKLNRSYEAVVERGLLYSRSIIFQLAIGLFSHC